MRTHQAEICIVGAGPAGTVCSLFLSQYKIPHVLVDKSTFPRDKVCGESFDGRVIRILNQLSPSYLEELYQQGLAHRTWNYSLHAKGQALPISFPKHNTPKLLAQRLSFDHFLYEKAVSSAYVTPIMGEAIQGMEHTESGLKISGRNVHIETKLGILANGAQSLLHSNQPTKKQEISVFIRAYYEGISPKATDEVEIYLLHTPVDACLSICPLTNGRYNVEIGLTQQDFKACGQKMDELLSTCLQAVDGLAPRFEQAKQLGKTKGTFMPMYSKIEQCADNHLMMIGANVFSVNPVTGLGVGNAMTMGMLAAEQAKQCVALQNFSSNQTKHYEKAIKKRLAKISQLNNIINFIQKHPHVFGSLIGLSLRNPLLKQLLNRSDLINQFANPKFYWNLLLQQFKKPTAKKSQQLVTKKVS